VQLNSIVSQLYLVMLSDKIISLKNNLTIFEYCFINEIPVFSFSIHQKSNDVRYILSLESQKSLYNIVLSDALLYWYDDSGLRIISNDIFAQSEFFKDDLDYSDHFIQMPATVLGKKILFQCSQYKKNNLTVRAFLDNKPALSMTPFKSFDELKVVFYKLMNMFADDFESASDSTKSKIKNIFKTKMNEDLSFDNVDSLKNTISLIEMIFV